jgi:hypothetical protein
VARPGDGPLAAHHPAGARLTIPTATTETVFDLTGSELGPFATGWTCASAADLAVWLDTGSGSAQLTSSQYTAAGAQPLVSGLEVTLASSCLPSGGAWGATAVLTLQRVTAAAQPFSFGDQVRGADIEAAFDHVVRMIQETQMAHTRTLRTNPGDYPSNLPPAETRATGQLVFNSSGNPGVDMP